MSKCSPEYLRLANDCRNQFAQASDSEHPLILRSEDLDKFREQPPGRIRLYPAIKTLSLFMKQVSNDDKSCSKVLIQDTADQLAFGQKMLKTKNDAYCKVRGRLNEHALKSLFQTSGSRLSDESPADWLWHHQRVVMTDGST